MTSYRFRTNICDARTEGCDGRTSNDTIQKSLLKQMPRLIPPSKSLRETFGKADFEC